jgi:hypothetical protein
VDKSVSLQVIKASEALSKQSVLTSVIFGSRTSGRYASTHTGCSQENHRQMDVEWNDW